MNKYWNEEHIWNITLLSILIILAQHLTITLGNQ